MKEYPKIETLYARGPDFKVQIGQWRCPEFDYLQHNTWLWTEKVDGTNIRVIWDGETVTFKGKSDDAQIPPFLTTKLQERFPVDIFTARYPDKPMCLYGEGYGAKIQKGGGNYKPKGVDFVLFDVLVDTWWLERVSVEDVGINLGVPTVPIVGEGNLADATSLVMKGFESTWGSFPAEGLVVRPLVTMFTRKGDRIIGKLKGKDFTAGKR